MDRRVLVVAASRPGERQPSTQVLEVGPVGAGCMNICSYIAIMWDVALPDRTRSRMIDPALVDETRRSVIDQDQASALAERFKLLSDPGRLRMIYALVEAGELAVCDLAAVVETTESATSHQLRQLRLAGLVRYRKDGRTVYYRVDDSHVRLLLDVAVEHHLHDHGLGT